MTKLTPEGSRAARALLNWSMRDLAAEAKIALATVQQIEKGGDFYASTGDKVIATFAKHGVEILNGDAPGARLKPSGTGAP